MSKIPWMEEVIEDVLPDGTPVKARCWYWAKDVNVEMISPYRGLRTGLHLMYMIPRRFTDNALWKTRALQMVETLVALSAYLNRRAGDKTGCILDAWREIAREDDAWCATEA